MIIQSSSIGMNSARRYASSKLESTELRVWNNNAGVSRSLSGDEIRDVIGDKPAENGYVNIARNILEKNAENLQYIKDAYNVSKSSALSYQNTMDKISRIRQETIEYLMRLLFGERCKENGRPQNTNSREVISKPQDTSSGEVGIGGNYSSYFHYYESETTSFNTTGTVITKEGKEICFDVSLTMSRKFEIESMTNIDFGTPNLCDPLVINLDCDAAEVTDQKFYFDLDADGHEEYISQLSYGSGYLALDKNKDGKINDGTELFGTTSGDGFADLRKYDTDNNGWIDEADEIFDQLLIWRMNEKGESELCALGKAGVGAIYLGTRDTEFGLKDSGNTTNGIIRKTGVFLYETGNVGIIQQLDLAT